MAERPSAVRFWRCSELTSWHCLSFSHQVISGPLVVHHRCSKNLNQMKHKRKYIKFLLSKTKFYLHPQQKSDIF